MPTPKRLRSALPQLFGHDNQNRILCLLAVDGPLTSPEVSRRLNLDRGETWRQLDLLRSRGLVEWTAPGAASLAAFFASDALHALLRKIGDASVGLLPAANDRVPREINLLFGSERRTTVLCALAVLQPIDVIDLSLLTRIEYSTVVHAVRHFVRERVVHMHKDRGRTSVELDRDFFAHKQLERLCETVAPKILKVAALKRYRAEIEQERSAAGERSRLPYGAEQYLPFGASAQARVLLEIANIDVTTSGRLAKRLGWTHCRLRGAVASLIAHRLVAVKAVGSGPQRKRWLALDPRHPLHDALRQFAADVVGPMQRFGGNRPARFPEVGRAYRAGEMPLCLIGEEVPNAIMLALLKRASMTPREIAKAIGRPVHKTLIWLRRMNGVGTVRFEKREGTMRAWLDPDAPHAKAIRRLLAAALDFITAFRGKIETRHECMDARFPRP